MIDSAQDQLMAAVARNLVEQMAPKELPLFPIISREYFAHPERLPQGRDGEDEMLGFGTGEVVALSAVILPIIAEIVHFLADEVKKSIKEQSAERIHETVKKYFNTAGDEQEEETESLALTAEQMVWIRKRILRKCRQMKLSEMRAQLLADAVIGSLATTPRKQ